MTRIDYELQWLQAEQSTREPLRALLRAAMASLDIRGRCVVEVGCGTGRNLHMLPTANQVIGLEGLRDAADEARRAGIDCRHCDLETRPWPVEAASADVLLALDVLEHLREPEEALAEARRVLRPDGLVVINLPNHFDWRGRWRILRGSGIDSQRYFPRAAAWRYPHLRFLRHRDVLDLLKQAGFEIVKDWSAEQSSLPKAKAIARLGLRAPLRWLTAKMPDLLAAGFFVVARVARPPPAPSTGLADVSRGPCDEAQ